MTRRLLSLAVVLCLEGCARQAAPQEPLPALVSEPTALELQVGAEEAGASQTIQTQANPDAPRVPTIGGTRPATAQERATIEKLARAAESVRQLRFSHPITIEIEDDDAIAESLRRQIDDEEIERARLLYGALGLIDPNADLRAVFSDVLGEQVIGYYDPAAARLVVRENVMDGLRGSLGPAEIQEAQLVLVHELVHALQDQRLGLGESYDRERTADADNAFRAVVEGDATLAMLANALRGQGIPLSAATQGIRQMGDFVDMSAFVRGEKLDEAPALMRVTLVAPYLRGLQFVAAMHALGGWPSVNRAHRRPPTTTEQILHPAKFEAVEPAERFEVSRLPELTEAGYVQVAEDTLGELELGVYLGQELPDGVNEAAATGWGGDHLVVYYRGKEAAVVWWTTWDSEADAIEACDAARRVTPDGPSSIVERDGRAVLIVRGLPPGLHRPVRRAFGEFASEINRRRPPPKRRRDSVQ